jgi:preprotein translocase subunit YajC
MHFISLAYAAGQPETANPILSTVIPFAIIIVVFYLFLILPQQKQRKKHKEFIESLQKGDTVITSSGIYGKIKNIGEKEFTIEIAENVSIKILKDNIISKAL